MRIAFDTNILVYARGFDFAQEDVGKIEIASALLGRLAASNHLLFTPIQVLAELHHVMVRKARLSAEQAEAVVSHLLGVVRPIPTEASTLASAMTIHKTRGLQTFDAIIIAAAMDAQCDLLLSEDMQHGFRWGGLRLVNPFSPEGLTALD